MMSWKEGLHKVQPVFHDRSREMMPDIYIYIYMYIYIELYI